MAQRIVCVVGTRPEAIKMAPLILELRRPENGYEVRVLATGQHRELLDQSLKDFGISSDYDLALMRPNQSLSELTARAVAGLSENFKSSKPDMVLAQGDTTTVLCAALACYYHRIPFGHVEAGLRTRDKFFPFPEEGNRVLVGQLAQLHFAPTETNRQNLVREGIDDLSIHVTGNTVIDALFMIANQDLPRPVYAATERYILVTAHRRENFGKPMEEICQALTDLVDRHQDLSIVYPVHPNPNVRDLAGRNLGNHARIHLIDPTGYREFVSLMKHSYLILTDSGGVQEEGPSLGKPVLVMRDETERPEAVTAGTVRLVGPHREPIVASVEELLADSALYDGFTTVINPYGDGHASEKIVCVIDDWFTVKGPSEMRLDCNVDGGYV